MPNASTPKQWSLRLYRFAVFASVLSAVHFAHRQHTPFKAVDNLPANAIQTSPASDSIIGYAGPTNMLVAFGPDDRIARLEILSSADTPEHLAKIERSPTFLKSFDGLSREQAAAHASVDAVSGATLTCYAITNSIRKRLGATTSPSRFSHVPTLAETQKYFPTATGIVSSSPHADNILGYQGPSLTVTALGDGERVLGFHVPQTFDNQPYLDDALAEPYFMETFDGLTPAEVAAFDLESEGVEGVSGATLTSYALAGGIVAAMHAHTTPEPSHPALTLLLSPHEIGTALVTLLGILTAFTPLRGKPRFRLAFQVIVVAYLGLTAGNLLAQSLLVGWSRSGVPWQLAPGLAFLAAAALAIPWVTKRNVYCDHLCPHGAAQQLANRYSPFKNRALPPTLDRALRFVPPLTLLAVFVLTLFAIPVNLASVEPFNAYLVTIAGTSTLAIALTSLAAAFFTPLPYCRYGCPTGAVLTFLRSRGPADSFSRRDAAALTFLLIAIFFLL